MINAGKYSHKIEIFRVRTERDSSGFPVTVKTSVLRTYAAIKTTKGITLIRNDTDFEKAWTNFTIRFPKVAIDRDMVIEFRGKTYEILYLNNVDEASVELEIQAKEVTH